MTGLRFFTVYGPWGRPDMAYFYNPSLKPNPNPNPSPNPNPNTNPNPNPKPNPNPNQEHTNLKRRRPTAARRGSATAALTAAPAGKQVKRKEHKSIARTAFAEQLLQKLTAVAKGPGGPVHVSGHGSNPGASAWSASSACRRRSC